MMVYVWTQEEEISEITSSYEGSFWKFRFIIATNQPNH